MPSPYFIPKSSEIAVSLSFEDDSDGDEESDNAIEEGRFGSTTGLVFFDATANPEKYEELLARERDGEIQIVTRYRHGFASRIRSADEDVREYYSALKNQLLSYKGVKSRMSWACENFNNGRNSVARINVKSKTLYLYLALDPSEVASLEDGKYRINDLSAKKKYAGVPTLFKLKGPRKFKYATELIELLCAQKMSLSPVKRFKEIDYKGEKCTLEELVKSGDVKMMVSAVPTEK